MSDSQKYYCLGSDGHIYALGDHGDWEAAEDTAKSLDFDPIWTFGEETFNDWRKTLNHFHNKGE